MTETAFIKPSLEQDGKWEVVAYTEKHVPVVIMTKENLSEAFTFVDQQGYRAQMVEAHQPF